jgi:hypothetical protein
MKIITFGELLEQYIEITGEEANREQLSQLRDWIVTYERHDDVYNVLIEPPGTGTSK